MPKLIMTEGLPASGKSTWARERVKKSGGNIKRINKDDLREMIDVSIWSKNNERQIIEVRDLLVEYYLAHGASVIVDGTNLHPKHKKTLKEIAQKQGAQFETKSFLNVPLKTCIQRDANREKSVGRAVIVSMAEKFLGHQSENKVQYEPPVGAREAIIVDIDGTLAHGINKTRKPYEWDKVDTDRPDATVIDLVNKLSEDYTIILMSGRDGSCRLKTEQWLLDHDVKYDVLFMRQAGDSRNDTVVKKELFDRYVRDKYNIKFVLDDRDRVVDMWRNEIGLKVFQVAEGNF